MLQKATSVSELVAGICPKVMTNDEGHDKGGLNMDSFRQFQTIYYVHIFVASVTLYFSFFTEQSL